MRTSRMLASEQATDGSVLSYGTSGTMRTARAFGMPLAFLLLVFWGGGAVGCSCHAECASIAPGTPVADIPVIGGPATSEYCHSLSGQTTEEEMALKCCSDPVFKSDGGVKDCSAFGMGIHDCTKVPPTELREVGEPYGGWECAPDEGVGAPTYQCFVWVRDGGVVGVCGDCPPD